MFEQELSKLGFSEPTLIQAKVFEHFNKRDILAKAPTGSGKSLSFLLPLSKKEPSTLHTLIITPTRELAIQLQELFKKLHSPLQSALLIGGEALKTQEPQLNNAHIIFGTPGRLVDALQKGILNLDTINQVVLDEADRMLDMGFRDEVMQILKALPASKKTALFSATFNDEIKAFANEILQNPISLEANKENPNNITEYYTLSEHKKQSLLNALATVPSKKTLIFCETKEESFTIYEFLQKHNLPVTYINGNLDQQKRFEHLTLFKNGSKPLLVATNLAARGLDIDEIELIINYSLPLEKESYIHRIGRSARGDKKGVALSIITQNELPLLQSFSQAIKPLQLQEKEPYIQALFATIKINAGKKKKIRAGDILGFLCKTLEVDSSDIGSIDISKEFSYIALKKEIAPSIQAKLDGAKIKKAKVKAWLL